MIAVDTNILVYAHRSEAPFHEQAFECLKSLAEGSQRWGIPVSCIHEFLAVVTNPKVFRPASRYEQALAQVDAWLAAPHVQVLHSGPEHRRILSELTTKPGCKAGSFTTHALRPSVLKTMCVFCGVQTVISVDSRRSSQSIRWCSAHKFSAMAGVDVFPHPRVDLLVPLPAAEHAVVPHAGLDVVGLPIGTDVRAQALRSHRLAYCKRIMDLPAMQEWVAAAKAEPDEIDELDAEF